MKLLYKLLTLSALFFPIKMSAAVVQTDPWLTSMILLQTETLQDAYKTRSKHHTTIEIAQAAIAGAMDQVHKVEEKVLEYMANASGVLQNMYQVKRIGELVVTEIPGNLVNLSKSVPSNLKGTAITLFVNKTVTETTADIVALSDIVSKLVTSHYSFKNSSDQSNVNLLSAAERYSILQSVYNRLDKINMRLMVTAYCLKTFGWQELWKGLDRESWCNVMYTKIMAKSLINKWNKL